MSESNATLQWMQQTYQERTGKPLVCNPKHADMAAEVIADMSEPFFREAFERAIENDFLKGRGTKPLTDWLLNMQDRDVQTCVARCHIDPNYFGIYDLAMALSRNNCGTCWLSQRVTAKWANMHRSRVQRGIAWLVEHGWLELVHPASNQYDRACYRVLSHDEWLMRQTRPGQSCVTRVR